MKYIFYDYLSICMKKRNILDLIHFRINAIQKSNPVLLALNHSKDTNPMPFAYDLYTYLVAKESHVYHLSYYDEQILDHYNYESDHTYNNSIPVDEPHFIRFVLQSSQEDTPSIILPGSANQNLQHVQQFYLTEKAIIIFTGETLFKDDFLRFWDLKLHITRNVSPLTREEENTSPEKIAHMTIDSSDYKNLVVLPNMLSA